MGIATVGSAAAQPGPVSAIVPNRYIVTYRNLSIPGDAAAHAHAIGASLLRREDRLGLAIVQTATGEPEAVAMARLHSLPNVELVVHDRYVTASRLILRGGQAAPPVRPRSPIRIHPPTAPAGPLEVTPYDTYYSATPQGWAVQQVGGYGDGVPGGPAHGPWDTTRGKGVRIAILDSGVDPDHPDIAPNLVLNLSEIDQTALPSACDDGTPQDQAGHGTWTASLAAAALGPGTGLTVGVAPEASILNIKVLERMPSGDGSPLASQCAAGEPSGLLSWVIAGIGEAVANHADIVSMSLGTLVDLTTGDGAGLQAMFDQVTYAASQQGVTLIAAAGNDGIDLSNTRYVELPAQARGVLAIVAATNPACAQNLTSGAACTAGPVTLPYYSDYGAPLNALAAPGGSLPGGTDTGVSGWVRGACSNGKPGTADGLPTDGAHSYGCFNLGHTQYVQAMGTSASAPLAAGVAALLKAAHPAWTPETIIAALRSSATPAGTLPVGQVNAVAALAVQ